MSIRLFVFEKTASGSVYLGQVKELGHWVSGPLITGCFAGFSTPLTLTSGKNYRFALAVREGGASGLLRPLRFSSTLPPH